MKTLHDAQMERYAGAAYATIESLRAQNRILVAALSELALCNFNERNCASLETATLRVQRVAGAALTLAGKVA